MDILDRLKTVPETLTDQDIDMLRRVTQYSESRGIVQQIHYQACLIADQRNLSPTGNTQPVPKLA